MPETLRLWQELSGVKVREFLPFREGWIVNGVYYVYQIGSEICQESKI